MCSKFPFLPRLRPGPQQHLPGCSCPTTARVRTSSRKRSPRRAEPCEAVRMRQRWRGDAPGQGSIHKMAAALTFSRHLGRAGVAALRLPRGARFFGVHISPTGEKVTHTGQVTGAARRALEWAEPRSGSWSFRCPRCPGSSWCPVVPGSWVGITKNRRLSTFRVPRTTQARSSCAVARNNLCGFKRLPRCWS